jgi:hypothetical protein
VAKTVKKHAPQSPPVVGDIVQIDGTGSLIEGYYGQPVMIDGKCYEVRISPDGAGVFAHALDIPVGRIRVAHDRWDAMLVGTKYFLKVSGGKAPIDVPADRYVVTHYREFPPAGSPVRDAQLMVGQRNRQTGKPITWDVPAGAFADIAVGTPLAASLELTEHRQDAADLRFNMADAGGAQIDVLVVTGWSYRGPYPPAVSIIDPEGQVVHEGQIPVSPYLFSSSASASYRWDLSEIPAGDFTAVLNYDADPFAVRLAQTKFRIDQSKALSDLKTIWPEESPWQLFTGRWPAKRISRARLNFGAPGDRRDSHGRAWLGVPRATVSWATPVSVGMTMDGPGWYARDGLTDHQAVPQNGWVYDSGLRGKGKIVLDMISPETYSILAPRCEVPPAIDGQFDDACWDDAQPIPYANSQHQLDPKATLYLCQDDENLYIAFRREAATRDGKAVPFRSNAKKRTKDAGQFRKPRVWMDDEVEFMIADQTRQLAVQILISAGGGITDGLNKVAARHLAGAKWSYEWDYAVDKADAYWRTEIAVPLAVLRGVGIDTDRLVMNSFAQNCSGIGPREIVLTDPGAYDFGFCLNFLKILPKRDESEHFRRAGRGHSRPKGV